ncbi:MAG: hypothetical protein ABW032_09875 [Burkholderiaceae bacterium]
MPTSLPHRVIPADAYRVPRPFRAFAVRSEERCHEMVARAPYARIHLVRTDFLDAAARLRIASDAYPRVNVDAFSDVDYADADFPALAILAPNVADLAGEIAQALSVTRVLGGGVRACRRRVAARIEYLATRGAGFHNDVRGHWTRCLFWNLAIDAADVEFVMPHAGVRVALQPGDLIVFDQTMAHGLCRPSDEGQAMAASFEGGDGGRQLFLTGEIPLSDERWAALGSPWLPVEEHERRGALDLAIAEFDERGGAIKRPHALRDGLRRSVSHVGEFDESAFPRVRR